MPTPEELSALQTWLLDAIEAAQHPIVLLCGAAGAGKTTAAMILESRGFHRLSIDEQIWKQFGRYGIDYAASEYPRLQKLAAEAVQSDLEALLLTSVPVVVDNSFWSRHTRDTYKHTIESHQRRWVLLYLKVEPSVLRTRLHARGARFDANAAFPIGEELLNFYLQNFQEPRGEGELVFQPPPVRIKPTETPP